MKTYQFAAIAVLMIAVSILTVGCGKKDNKEKVWECLSKYPCRFLIVTDVQYDEYGDEICTCVSEDGTASTLTWGDVATGGNAAFFEEGLVKAPYSSPEGMVYSCFTDNAERYFCNVTIKRDGFLGIRTKCEDNLRESLIQYYSVAGNEINITDMASDEYADAILAALENEKKVFAEYGITAEMSEQEIGFVLYTMASDDFIDLLIPINADKDTINRLIAETEE